MDSRQWWQALAAAEVTVTVACAGLTAAFFFYAQWHEPKPNRRSAALALVLIALGVAIQATASLTWRAHPSLVVTAGLPACLGQMLAALLVLRQLGRE